MINERAYSKYFKAFGDPTRLRILAMLSSGEMSVGEIVTKIGLSQPTVSRHLGILRDADVVHDRRDGQNVYYSLNKDTVEGCCTGFCHCLEIKVKSLSPEKREKK